ncbi:hypothetical protein [Roseimaritima ulvae]|uniref:Uncharacterized protein n=1 Tax=Roseimaritima ulvae TaxID=980254 RepID=A0A5B9QYF1_9BACT|nr:hypothetical protein [Roseimaritima ulvae]QEG39001.1 hypothetical protein UC8_09620 [Roseimaritima ulvae]
MKTNRHQPIPTSSPQNRWPASLLWGIVEKFARAALVSAKFLWALLLAVAASPVAGGQPADATPHPVARSAPSTDSVVDPLPTPNAAPETYSDADSDAQRLRQQAAAALIERTVVTLASGPAFDAKLTQQVRTPDHTAVGVGRYEQAGGNTGRVHMDMDISISQNQKCQLLQKCDGRLAWTREQVGDTVRLRRVDVGRLDEMVAAKMSAISPRLRVGGLIELLERAHADFALEQVPAELEGHPVWMLKGSLRPAVKTDILRRAEREEWPPLCPNAIAIAIAADNNDNGFGKGLPVRFEYWLETEAEAEQAQQAPTEMRRLISYLKIYDLQKIQPAPETHFRLETGESDVNYTNDTQRYLDHFGIQVTEKQQRLLTR